MSYFKIAKLLLVECLRILIKVEISDIRSQIATLPVCRLHNFLYQENIFGKKSTKWLTILQVETVINGQQIVEG